MPIPFIRGSQNIHNHQRERCQLSICGSWKRDGKKWALHQQPNVEGDVIIDIGFNRLVRIQKKRQKDRESPGHNLESKIGT